MDWQTQEEQYLTKEEKETIAEEAENLNISDYTLKEEENWSAKVYRILANDILPKPIRMKKDTPWHHSNLKLPILDTEMRMEGYLILYWHYRKPIASLELTLAKTAMSMANKISILMQEG